jgi:hypothetical protein
MNGKRLSLAAVISLTMLSLWGIAGCSKNSSNSTTSDGTMTATVNGVAYNAKSYVIAGYLTTYGQLIVQGDSINNNDTAEIQVAIPYPPTVNIAISTDSSAFTSLTYIRGGVEYDAFNGYGYSHGVVTVTSSDTVNHRIAGNFSGVLYSSALSADSVVFSNGAFSTTYVVQ